ncbi:MAG: hypothetical protein Q4D98_02415 [Planctomycetia bacterium]|nr:hypothetical protein [Planctomycetia bacterium]
MNRNATFFDWFRALLGWRSVQNAEVPTELRVKSSPAGVVFVPTAVRAVVHS